MGTSKPRSPTSKPDSEVEVSCEATPENLGTVHDPRARVWGGLHQPPPDEWRMLFAIAVSEIAANIVQHARPQVMTLNLKAIGSEVTAEFTDTGDGWMGP